MATARPAEPPRAWFEGDGHLQVRLRQPRPSIGEARIQFGRVLKHFDGCARVPPVQARDTLGGAQKQLIGQNIVCRARRRDRGRCRSGSQCRSDLVGNLVLQCEKLRHFRIVLGGKQGRAVGNVPGAHGFPSFVFLAADERLSCFALRVERVEFLLKAFLGRLARVDRAPYRRELGQFDKDRGVRQAPVHRAIPGHDSPRPGRAAQRRQNHSSVRR